MTLARSLPLLLLAAAACGTAEARDAARPADALPAWSAPVPITSLFGATRGRDPRIAALAVDAGGRPHALVADDADGDGVADVLLHAWMQGADWSAAERLDVSPGLSDGARLVADGAGGVHAVWYEHTRPGTPPRSADALLHRVWRGGAWGAPSVVRAAADSLDMPLTHLDAALDARGRLHLVHETAAGLAESVWAHGRWGEAVPTGRDGATPALAPGAGVMAYVAGWAEAHGGRGSSDVLVRARRADGTWDEPVPVHVDPREYSHLPQLATAGDGTLHAVWLETRGGEVTPRRLMHARAADGRRWSPAVEITPPQTEGQILYSPRLSVDGRGRVLLVFTRFGDGGVGRPTHWQMRLGAEGWSPAERLFAALGESDSEIETARGADGVLWAVFKSGDGVYYAARARP
ncbi:hypothetical protein [Longimicrobium sp.]|uniref:hypothetical protein n=1 Tax=Longimicrobium sp. TaxID=2029185 RepID=UPI002EDA3642